MKLSEFSETFNCQTLILLAIQNFPHSLSNSGNSIDIDLS